MYTYLLRRLNRFIKKMAGHCEGDGGGTGHCDGGGDKDKGGSGHCS
jgi:hypothetical protein